jgi:ABC-type branched-subunit amino acid transport system substrate-binding protein
MEKNKRMPAARYRGKYPLLVVVIQNRNLWLIVLIIVAIGGVWAGYNLAHASTPVRIGVLLPVTGELNYREPLEWAKDSINNEGGIGGRKVELVYRDTGTGSTEELAQDFLHDDSIRIIIGPHTSDEVYALAPAFIEKKKVLITPTATSGDIIRAFGKSGYVWRTTQGDAAQVRTILSILKEKGVTRIALLAENSTYGKTFYDWTGFFATEYGIDVTYIGQYEPGSPLLENDVNAALKTNPDYLVAACFAKDAATIWHTTDRSGSKTRLFLTDAAATPQLVQELGSAAEGIEGTSPTADPRSLFIENYTQKFGHSPENYAAPTYDALLIAAFVSARQDAVMFEPLSDSVRKIVFGDGVVTGWDAEGIRTAVREILAGRLPWITGASGGLEYDEELGVDQIYTYYSYWVVQHGTFVSTRTFSSEDVSATGKSGGESAGLSTASAGLMSAVHRTPASEIPRGPKTGFSAVIAGPSAGWPNYRHQADALTLYRMLHGAGVSDDQIILMVYDDVPTAKENPIRGDIHNIPKGSNLRPGAEIDYSGPAVSTQTLENVLTGKRTAETPVVLESDAGTDLFVYIVSHGAPGKINFRRDDAFTAEDMARITDRMYQERKYRQVFFMVDTCFGESVATNVTAPGILYLTGAAKNEPSLGAVYDSDIRQWLSDEFTVNVMKAIQSDPGITFRKLYPAIYRNVTGSHVRMIDTGNFSLDTPVMKYF